jgi:hypothetical protein
MLYLIYAVYFKADWKSFPSIYPRWKKYQSVLVEKIKSHGGLVITGDG